MAALTPYNRLKNFTQYALDHPSATYNASDHDAELNAVELTLDGLVTNLGLLQRSDGLLANATVHPDSLSTATKALIAATWTPRGLWITATAYVVGDVVETGGTSYVCATAHTSGTFATDKAAGKWVVLGGTLLSLAASAVTFAASGNISAADVQAALQELDSEKAKLAGDGAQNFSAAAASAAAHAVRLDQAQNNSLWFAVGAGSGNAITATITPTGFTALPDGFEVCVRAPGANTITNPTFNLTLGSTATGAKTVARGDSGAVLQAGDIAGSSHELRLRYRSGTDKWHLLNPGTVPISITNVPSQQGLLDYLHVDSDTGHRDLIRGGWTPAFFNQQWGGAPHYFELVDTATGVPYKFEAATGYIEDGSTVGTIADAAARTWDSQGFKVSKNTTLAAMWVKIYKSGNPANNLECRILPDDGTGKPNGAVAITNGTATAQSGKLHSSDTSGQWVRFVFPTPPSLTAGTQYHIALKSSGAADATNYWNWKSQNATGHYPHGQVCQADATPVWTGFSTNDFVFLAEIAAADESLTTGGIFSDGKLTFFEGASGVLNQSNGRVKDLRDFAGLDLTDFTLAVFGNSWTKDKTILDITYGLDHDRIVLRCNVTTGYAQLDLYDSAGNKKTVSGTVDVSGSNSLLGVRVRAKGDGQDVVELWENGARAAASLSSQTISFDKLYGLAKLGTFWLGGGWQVTPAWTKDTAMGTLPSADGWTWTGTGTEANCMSVAGGKLFQNKNGYASTDSGYYLKSALGFNNANGASVAAKVRVASGTNTKTNGDIHLAIEDGTKKYWTLLQEYYAEQWPGASLSLPQVDCKASENVLHMAVKGSDALIFFNGRLIADSTGQNTSGSANNQVAFGDQSATPGENADAVWDYVKYYNTAWLAPQFTAGALSELAIWNGDRTSLLATLWNAGTPIAVKQLCGMTVNTGPEVVQRRMQLGITSSPTTTSGTPALVPEGEMFVVGSEIVAGAIVRTSNSGANAYGIYIALDGFFPVDNYDLRAFGAGTEDKTTVIPSVRLTRRGNASFGLHKVDVRASTGAGTQTHTGAQRTLQVEARA